MAASIQRDNATMADASTRARVSSMRWYVVALGVFVSVLSSRAPMMLAFLRDATEFVVTWRYDGASSVVRAPRNDNDQGAPLPGTGGTGGDATKMRRLSAELEEARARHNVGLLHPRSGSGRDSDGDVSLARYFERFLCGARKTKHRRVIFSKVSNPSKVDFHQQARVHEEAVRPRFSNATRLELAHRSR